MWAGGSKDKPHLGLWVWDLQSVSCLCTNRWKDKAPEGAEGTVNSLMGTDGHGRGRAWAGAAHLRVLASREWLVCTLEDRPLLHWGHPEGHPWRLE